MVTKASSDSTMILPKVVGSNPTPATKSLFNSIEGPFMKLRVILEPGEDGSMYLHYPAVSLRAIGNRIVVMVVDVIGDNQG